ncbi:hypothetical protein DPMN_130688 [Dreissena polymorpha]|uniref:Uncharacterized protein n=1 Tax=Dreissena polymorpha TaxID=45954 RepID=A0A9D4H3B5_DREPO|nr:hypothetical protein DPMN_130688 [Dreissena polymorpha]
MNNRGGIDVTNKMATSMPTQEHFRRQRRFGEPHSELKKTTREKNGQEYIHKMKRSFERDGKRLARDQDQIQSVHKKKKT